MKDNTQGDNTMGMLGIWFNRVIFGDSAADEALQVKLQEQRIAHEKKIRELEERAKNASEERRIQAEFDIERTKAEYDNEEQKLIQRFRLEQAKEQTNLRIDEKNYDFFLQRWPIGTPPIIFNKISVSGRIRVIIAPISNDSTRNLPNNDWLTSVTSLLSLYWGATSTHPIEFHDSWREEVPSDTGAIYSLFSVLRGTPAIVVCPKLKDEGRNIIFRFAIWLPESAAPQITDLFDLPVPQAEFSADWLQQASVLVTMALGSIADAYYLRENGLPPALPKMAVRLSRNNPAAIEWAFPNIAPLYKDIIESCSTEVCQTAASLPDRYTPDHDEMLDIVAYFLSEKGLGLSPETDMRIASELSWSKAVCAAAVAQLPEDALVSAIRESWKQCGENELSIENAKKIATVVTGSPGLKLYWRSRQPIAIAFEQRVEFVAYSLFTTGFPNVGGQHWLPAKKLCRRLADDLKQVGIETAMGKLDSYLLAVATELHLPCGEEVIKKSSESPLLRDNVIHAANMLLRY